MRYMVRMTFTCLMLMVSQLAAFDHRRDAKAEELAHTVMNAMGGEKAWYGAHFVRFDFKVNAGGKTVADRSHLWDKMSGRYRIEQLPPTTYQIVAKPKSGDLRIGGFACVLSSSFQ